MKQYLLFSGMNYYPSGGWKDFEGGYETLLEAIKNAALCMTKSDDWWHVVDSTTGEIVESNLTA